MSTSLGQIQTSRLEGVQALVAQQFTPTLQDVITHPIVVHLTPQAPQSPQSSLALSDGTRQDNSNEAETQMEVDEEQDDDIETLFGQYLYLSSTTRRGLLEMLTSVLNANQNMATDVWISKDTCLARLSVTLTCFIESFHLSSASIEGKFQCRPLERP